MISISYGAGIARCDPLDIAFLWRNWEVFFALWNGPFKVKRVTDTSWRAKGFMAEGEWHLVRYRCDVDSGVFVTVSYIKFFGFLFNGETIFRYQKIDDERVFFVGVGAGAVPKWFRWMIYLFVPLLSHRGKLVAQNGGAQSERISANSKAIEIECGKYTYLRYKNFREGLEVEGNFVGDGLNGSPYEPIAWEPQQKEDIEELIQQANGKPYTSKIQENFEHFLETCCLEGDSRSFYAGLISLLHYRDKPFQTESQESHTIGVAGFPETCFGGSVLLKAGTNFDDMIKDLVSNKLRKTSGLK